MRPRKTGPAHVEYKAPELPAWLATEIAFYHMPGLNRAGLRPPVGPRMKRTRRPSV